MSDNIIREQKESSFYPSAGVMLINGYARVA